MGLSPPLSWSRYANYIPKISDPTINLALHQRSVVAQMLSTNDAGIKLALWKTMSRSMSQTLSTELSTFFSGKGATIQRSCHLFMESLLANRNASKPWTKPHGCKHIEPEGGLWIPPLESTKHMDYQNGAHGTAIVPMSSTCLEAQAKWRNEPCWGCGLSIAAWLPGLRSDRGTGLNRPSGKNIVLWSTNTMWSGMVPPGWVECAAGAGRMSMYCINTRTVSGPAISWIHEPPLSFCLRRRAGTVSTKSGAISTMHIPWIHGSD
jgi:hypothetical protein